MFRGLRQCDALRRNRTPVWVDRGAPISHGVAVDESKFELVAGRTLAALEDALMEADDNLEVGLSMGVLTIEFDDGAKFVVNSHRAARQIWMSANSSAWHFDYKDGHWRSTKTDEELWALLSIHVSQRMGRSVTLAPQ